MRQKYNRESQFNGVSTEAAGRLLKKWIGERNLNYFQAAELFGMPTNEVGSPYLSGLVNARTDWRTGKYLAPISEALNLTEAELEQAGVSLVSDRRRPPTVRFIDTHKVKKSLPVVTCPLEVAKEYPLSDIFAVRVPQNAHALPKPLEAGFYVLCAKLEAEKPRPQDIVVSWSLTMDDPKPFEAVTSKKGEVKKKQNALQGVFLGAWCITEGRKG